MHKGEIHETIFGYIIMLIFVGTFISMIIGCFESDEYKKVQAEKQEIIQGQENCEHEYVALSKYKLISGRYKIIQKCTKCGKELEEDWGI